VTQACTTGREPAPVWAAGRRPRVPQLLAAGGQQPLATTVRAVARASGPPAPGQDLLLRCTRAAVHPPSCGSEPIELPVNPGPWSRPPGLQPHKSLPGESNPDRLRTREACLPLPLSRHEFRGLESNLHLHRPKRCVLPLNDPGSRAPARCRPWLGGLSKIRQHLDLGRAPTGAGKAKKLGHSARVKLSEPFPTCL
jgi:hypothetical protein